MIRMVLAAACAVLLLAGTAQAQGKIVKLTSLEWPPYTGPGLPGQGASAEVVRQAFQAMGYTVEIEFLPWNRAVQTAKEDPAFIGYFPEYPSEEVAKEFIFSQPMGVGPLGLVQKANAPVAWSTVQDLSQITVGIVAGYVNPPAVQQMIDAGTLKVEESADDITSIRKVAMGRMDAALIDKFVFNYLLAADPSLAELKANVAYNAKDIMDWDLHVCFRNDAAGEEMARVFNEGLAKINWRAVQDQQIKTILEAR